MPENDIAVSSGPLDGGSILAVIVIVLLAGILGGFAAYITVPRDANASEPARAAILRYIVLGVMASACVPLFLTLVQSDLVKRIFAGSGQRPFAEYLVFVGFCLLAAFSARAFLESISRRVLRDLEGVRDEQQHLQQNQQNIQQQVRETQELVVDQQGKAVEAPVIQEAVAAESLARVALPPTTPLERRALRAMSSVGFRTVGGIAEDLEMSRLKVDEVLRSLQDKGLVGERESPVANVMRWTITAAGQAVLAAGEAAAGVDVSA